MVTSSLEAGNLETVQTKSPAETCHRRAGQGAVPQDRRLLLGNRSASFIQTPQTNSGAALTGAT